MSQERNPTDDTSANPATGPRRASDVLEALDLPSREAAVRNPVGRLSALHLVLGGVAGAVVSVVAMLLLNPRQTPAPPTAPQVPEAHHAGSPQPATDAVQPTEPEPLDSGSAELVAVSRRRAEEDFAAGRYAEALVVYQELARLAETDGKADRLRDFFHLRCGQCYRGIGQVDAARAFIEAVVHSRSPAVRAAAAFELARLDRAAGAWLAARTRAYQTLADIAALDEDAREAAQRDCDVLVAHALTRSTVRHETPGALPDAPPAAAFTPFAGVPADGLSDVLDRGVLDVDGPLLEIAADTDTESDGAMRWSARTWRAPADEILAACATRSGMDLQWIHKDSALRGRPVSVHVSGVTARRLAEVVAGSVGLVARFTGDAIIVHDPTQIDSLQARRTLLSDEAISAWRRLCLTVDDDARLAAAHYSLALLLECAERPVEAVNEYQLTARRFPREAPAARALLRSALARIELGDHPGARSDLNALLDVYPECGESAEAYLALGRASLETGRHAEALRSFRKLYFLDLSAASQAAACLGAARTSAAIGDHAAAVTWIQRFLQCPNTYADRERYVGAMVLLARSLAALGDSRSAIAACRKVLKADPDNVSAAVDLADLLVTSDLPLAALTVLGGVQEGETTAPQFARLVLLKGRAYRRMQLPANGIEVIRRGLAQVTDVAWRTKLAVEMAACHRDLGEDTAAHNLLSEALGELNDAAVACDLAELCLRLERTAEAESLARQVLDSDADQPLLDRARRTLVRALIVRGKLDAAVGAVVEPPPVQTARRDPS